jgi:hypothetical protein
MSLGRDGLAGLILLVISLALVVQSLSLPSLPIVPVGPGFFPRIVLIFVACASIGLVAQDVLKRRRSEEAGLAPAAPRRNYGIVIVAFAIVGSYVLLLPLLGFRVATVMFVAVLQAALDRPRTLRRWTELGAIALGTALITYIVFERYLLVLLPRGSWTGF